MAPEKKIVVIVGTNASGKSSLGVELARSYDGEVISADSRQVYRGLDIGTGKLSTDEMMGVPHHLVDVADVTGQFFTLADFQSRAYFAIDDILARRRVPIIVGGTGLYVRSITEGYRLVDSPPNFVRRAEREKLSALDLWEELKQRDPDSAALLDARNKRRVIRALELADNGLTYSEPSVNTARYNSLQLGVTWPAEVLRQRIMTRLRMRLAEGMVEETEALLARGVSVETLDALGLEYRFIVRYVKGEYSSRDEFVEKLAIAIYRFSRRQMSWFRKEASIIWLDTEQDYTKEAKILIDDFLR